MEKYVLIKLAKTPGNVDFLQSHKEIIDKNGFVDFARVSKRRICSRYICENTIFIKESKTKGNRIFKADIGEEIEQGIAYPKYYEKLDLCTCQWMRIKTLEIVDEQEFLRTYHLLNGKSLEGTFRGAVPWVFIQKD